VSDDTVRRWIDSDRLPATRDAGPAQVDGADLARLAAREGWQYVDPMTEVRDEDGDYRDGATLDGVHPSGAAAAQIGVALHEALLHPSGVGPAGQTG